MRISTAQFQRASISAILDRQVELSKLQNQMATGKRVLSPADDPVAATRAQTISEAIDKTKQYQNNGSVAASRLQLMDSALGEFENNLQRLNELTIQANNGTLSQLDRATIAKEVQVRLDSLQSIANTQDANGEYIFSGSQVTNKTVAYNGTSFTYQGDDTQRSLEVGAGIYLPETSAGSDVFFNVPNGSRSNGYLSDINPANTGTGTIDSVRVTNNLALTKHKYQIDYVGPNFTVTDVTQIPAVAVATVPAAPGPGTPFTFDGLQVTINGAPVAGDQYVLEPSTSEDVFTTVKRLADSMTMTITTPADQVLSTSDMRRSIEQLQNAIDHISLARADIGGRLNSVDSQNSINEDVNLNLQKVQSDLTDLDYAQASSELNLKLTGMQAAQQVYVKAQGLSLFNLIG
jgi:flagellar hook-associated protein 3 FlgL